MPATTGINSRIKNVKSQIAVLEEEVKRLEKKAQLARRMPEKDLYPPRTVLKVEDEDENRFWIFARDKNGVWRARGENTMYDWDGLVDFLSTHNVASVEVAMEWRSILGPYLP